MPRLTVEGVARLGSSLFERPSSSNEQLSLLRSLFLPLVFVNIIFSFSMSLLQRRPVCYTGANNNRSKLLIAPLER